MGVEVIKVAYKGFDIVWNEGFDKWTCDEVCKGSQSLEAVKKKIDEHNKKTSEFKGMSCLARNSWSTGDFKKGTITSVTESGEFWVSFGRDGRQKMANVCKDTEENSAIISKVKELKETAHKAEQAAMELVKTMELINPVEAAA